MKLAPQTYGETALETSVKQHQLEVRHLPGILLFAFTTRWTAYLCDYDTVTNTAQLSPCSAVNVQYYFINLFVFYVSYEHGSLNLHWSHQMLDQKNDALTSNIHHVDDVGVSQLLWDSGAI